MRTAIATLMDMSTKGLQRRWSELFGRPTTNRNTVRLRKQIAEKLRLGPGEPVRELAAESLKKAAAVAKAAVRIDVKVFQHDPRVMAAHRVGDVLERALADGQVVRAKILADGFESNGKHYTSLSAIAKAETGREWNGFVFFKLVPYPAKERIGRTFKDIARDYDQAAAHVAGLPESLMAVVDSSDHRRARAAAAAIRQEAARMKAIANVLQLGANVIEARHGQEVR